MKTIPCFDTHDLRSLYTRFPPRGFFSTVQKLSTVIPQYRNRCKF